MIAWQIKRLASTASTNDDAKLAGDAGAAEGLVVHALQQSAGRGRHGRTWQSPEGNLYCSALLRPGAVQNYGFYSFIAALALAATVREFLADAAVDLKWPNDVLVNGKKISGILLEAGTGYLVVGMGLNVMHHPEDALYPSTSLHAMGAGNPEIDVVLGRLLHHLDYWQDKLGKEGFAPIRIAWLEHARQGRMTVKELEGSVEGVFENLDEQGHLILRLADGSERAIATGDVFFAPKG